MRSFLRLLALACAVTPCGCTERLGSAGPEESASGETDATDATDATGDGLSEESGGESDGPFDGADDWDLGDDGGGFLGDDDGFDGGFCSAFSVCDLWSRDCPDGEKCTPIACAPGSNTLDIVACVPVGAAGVGEPCSPQPGPQGTDSCDEGGVCLGIVDGVGRCAGFCQAPEAEPSCAEPGETCLKLNDGWVNLCGVPCDPAQAGSCAANEVCAVALDPTPDAATGCIPALPTSVGDACGSPLECGHGQTCVEADATGPTCIHDNCCTVTCDASEPSPCPAETPECVPLGLDAYPDAGFCRLP